MAETPTTMTETIGMAETAGTSADGRTSEPAVLVLEDGKRYEGRAYGARGRTLGEAVFATGMTGYQETLTDPSYAGQIVMMTAPHIGNTGMNDEDDGVGAHLGRRVHRARPLARRVEPPLPAQPRRRPRRGGRRRHQRHRHPRRHPHLRSAGAMRAGIFSGDDATLTPTASSSRSCSRAPR